MIPFGCHLDYVFKLPLASKDLLLATVGSRIKDPIKASVAELVPKATEALSTTLIFRLCSIISCSSLVLVPLLIFFRD